ncbi:MAG: YidC/Oxa1 family membrane protein insertase [Clostridiales bacterium]|nr:YidC/Oxa1 family membrane protein insertase [Clostridiales bacterium]
MNAIVSFLSSILEFITGIVNNHGVSIIIFTILMRLVCLPFDFKSRKGMRKMTEMQPKLNALQKKYGNDKQKFQQKQAELMRKEHYNPMSGCLPMLLTWPLMIAMFTAMREIANEQLALQAFRYLAGDENAIMAADRFLWIKNIWMTDSPFAPVAPDANSLSMLTKDVWQRAYAMLTESQLLAVEQGLSLVPGAVLDFTSNEALKQSVAYITEALNQIDVYKAAVQSVPGWANVNFFLFSITVFKDFNGLLILPALAGITQILQTKLNPQQNMDQNADSHKNGTANFMKWFFPVLSVFFCLTSNAGFAVYWVTSNVVMGVQSVLITKYFDRLDQKKAKSVSGEGSVK